MQKAGLLTALALTVVVAVYAYPKPDKGATAARITTIGAERDSTQPTPLDKLKAATRVGVNPQDTQATLPPPRVMESVKQQIQTRPPAHDPAAAALKPAGATESANDKSGIDKLAAKLPQPAEAPPPNTAGPQPAPTHASTVVVPGSNTATAAGSATPQPHASEADAVPAVANPVNTANPEKRRQPQRQAGAELRNSAPARFVRGTVAKPNEGM